MYRAVDEIAGVPAALCAPSDPVQLSTARAAPVVLLWHGLGGEKEDELETLEHLAGLGFVSIALDAIGHGGRRSAALEARLDADDPAVEERALLDVVEQTAAELPQVLDALEGRGWLGAGVGLIGTSMGAHIALKAAEDPRVDAVVALSGSPRWADGRPGSPEAHVDAAWPCAMLLVHGRDDDVVPLGPSVAYVQALRASYREAPERVEHLVLDGEGHLLSAAGTAVAADARDGWLRRWLPLDHDQAR